MTFSSPSNARYFEDYVEGDVHSFGSAVVDATTVATGRPASARANASAARPGGSSAPEIIAASVSSTW